MEKELSNVLERIARELTEVKKFTREMLNYMSNAEAEIPEKMRRFANYFHDLHDIKFMHEEVGVEPPNYILRELERLDDRFRQVLIDLHTDGNTFEKVRREMASDKYNRYDHTRLLHHSMEKKDETGKSNGIGTSGAEGGTEPPRG